MEEHNTEVCMSWKELGKKLLFPPLWMICILVVFSTIVLVWIFIKGLETSLIAYPLYVVAFYTLVILSLACWKTIPGSYKRLKGRVHENEYASRYLTDAAFKTHVNLYGSLGVNLIYVLVNAVAAILFQTHWFAIFATYYGILAMMRFLLVRYVSHSKIGSSYLGELKRARLCAYILLTVNMALSAAVLMMVYFKRGFQYQGLFIYVMALYTFYITTAAIVNMVKYRKYKSPVMSISKIINLAAALFSMLFLETAMFAQFGGEMSAWAKQLMIMMTGAGISVVVVAMSLYMIVRTTGEIRKL